MRIKLLWPEWVRSFHSWCQFSSHSNQLMCLNGVRQRKRKSMQRRTSVFTVSCVLADKVSRFLNNITSTTYLRVEDEIVFFHRCISDSQWWHSFLFTFIIYWKKFHMNQKSLEWARMMETSYPISHCSFHSSPFPKKDVLSLPMIPQFRWHSH